METVNTHTLSLSACTTVKYTLLLCYSCSVLVGFVLLVESFVACFSTETFFSYSLLFNIQVYFDNLGFPDESLK